MRVRKHILIVDDDIELANLLAQAVGDVSEVYEVRVARDVDNAMVLVNKAQTSQQPFDLVITDIKMVGLSGLELLEALESIAPQTKTITMTAYNSPDLAQRAQELNVYAYLTKPFVLSEFRQIVHSALYPSSTEPNAETARPVTQLTVAQKVAVGKHLAELRVMAGTTAAWLMHSSGVMLATDPLEGEIAPDDLCAALTNAHQAVTQQMRQTFNRDTQIRQSYFGTDTWSVCTYRLDDQHAVSVIFGPSVKEGQVWYCIREAAKGLKDALTTEEEGTNAASRQNSGDVFEMLDQFFPNRRKLRASKLKAADEKPPKPKKSIPEELDQPVIEEIQEPETDPVTSPLAPDETREPEAVPVASPLALDEIDWSVPATADWDQIAGEADRGFSGISFEEAREQGLLELEVAEIQEPEPPAAEPEAPADPALLTDIRWDVAVDTDWDAFIGSTDMGLPGISLEEAKKQGLVSDLGSE